MRIVSTLRSSCNNKSPNEMLYNKLKTLLFIFMAGIVACSGSNPNGSSTTGGNHNSGGDNHGGSGEGNATEWKLVWEDDFNYENSRLDASWNAENGTSGHIDCSRWRSNVTTADGKLYLNNKKEQKGGKQWTSGSIWTKKTFKYGKFECRYKYAEATGVNNSFWIFLPSVFELDINEGKYPNVVDMTIHDWSTSISYPDGTSGHPTFSSKYIAGSTKVSKPGYSFELPASIQTQQIRLTIKDAGNFQIKEIRIFPKSSVPYPDPLTDDKQQVSSLPNYALQATVKASGYLQAGGDQARPYDVVKPENAVDGDIQTAWYTEKNASDKYIELTWNEKVSIGCIQLVNGWKDGSGIWRSLSESFRIEYRDGDEWKTVTDHNFTPTVDLSKDFHTYAVEWNKDEIIWLFDGKELWRKPNQYFHKEASIYLSAAIADWVGPVTDRIDGTSMVVDWVKVYQKEEQK